MVAGIYRNWSHCHPDPNWSDPAQRAAVKLDNAIEAYRKALDYIVSTNTAAAIFEDDVVLATSRREVQHWLDEVSTTNHTVQKKSSEAFRGRKQVLTSYESYARHEYDLGTR